MAEGNQILLGHNNNLISFSAYSSCNGASEFEQVELREEIEEDEFIVDTSRSYTSCATLPVSRQAAT